MVRQAASVKNVSAARPIIRAEKRVTQAELTAQRSGLRLFGEKAIRPAFDDEAIYMLRPDDAAQARARLDQKFLDIGSALARAGERIGSGEA